MYLEDREEVKVRTIALLKPLLLPTLQKMLLEDAQEEAMIRASADLKEGLQLHAGNGGEQETVMDMHPEPGIFVGAALKS